MKRALLAGSTGLIGNQLLDLLLEDSSYEEVIALSRTPLQKRHSKLKNIIATLETLKEAQEQLKADDIFCCLGTTIKVAGSQEAFRKVDFDYPLALARISKSHGAKQYLLVSALGADKNSSIFYNRVKGEMEESLISEGFECVHFFRPSLLVGERKEKRLGEDVGKIVSQIFGWAIPNKYKAIDSAKVARGMLHFAKMNLRGVHIHESGELQKL